MNLHAMSLDVPASPGALQDYFEEHGWTDGLPIVPPTPELVAAMVAASGLPGDAEVMLMAPSQLAATVEKIAINAVMAGCKPGYMPVVVAALRAMARPEWNLAGVQATTHPVAPLIFINGPIRQQLAVNCGSNVCGQGARANATIGRAVRLVMMNIGLGIPGKTDMATLGSPCKYSFCAGENEEESPWAPYHVDQGFDAADSTVMVHAAEGPHNMQDHGSCVPEDLLITIADTINITGNNNAGLMGEVMLILSPEHAAIMASTGMSKDDIRYELHRRMRLKLSRFPKRLHDWYRKRRPAVDVGPEVEEIPYLDTPEQIVIMVAGGAGLHSVVVPSFGGMSKSTIEKIVLP